MTLLQKIINSIYRNIGNVFIFLAITIFFLASCFICFDFSIVPLLYLLGVASFALGIYSRTQAFRKIQNQIKEQERQNYKMKLIGEKK